MKKYEFYKPEYQQIPTQLMLKTGDIQINYSRLHDKFAYQFGVYGIKTENEGREIVDELASIMCSQSYDHGSKWRVTGTELIEPLSYSGATWEVSFRIKDSF